MPLLSIDGATVLPGRPGRKGLVLYLHTGDATYGWGGTPDEYPIATNTGIPLPLGQMISFFDPEGKSFAQPMYFYNETGIADLAWQEIL